MCAVAFATLLALTQGGSGADGVQGEREEAGAGVMAGYSCCLSQAM